MLQLQIYKSIYYRPLHIRQSLYNVVASECSEMGLEECLGYFCVQIL